MSWPVRMRTEALRPRLREALTNGGHSGGGGGDAGDDMPARCLRPRPSFDLFVEAPEDGGVAALEADDLSAIPGVFHQQGIDVLLPHLGAETLLAGVDHRGLATGQFKNACANKAVVDDHVRFIERATGFERQQFRITGPRTDKGHVTRTDGFGLVRIQEGEQRGLNCSLALRNGAGARP